MTENWVGIAALAVAVFVGITGYFSRPTFTTAGRAQDLRNENAQLRMERDDARAELQAEVTRNRILLGESEYLRDELRRLRDARASRNFDEGSKR